MKRVLSVALLSLGMIGVTTLTAPPASAEVTSYTITKSFKRAKKFYSAPLGRCLRVKVTGSMSAFYVRSTEGPPTPADYQSLQDPKLKNLTLRLTTTDTCFDGSPRERVKKATMRQSYYYWKCSSNPSISVSAPWSAGVSITPSCGDEKVARRSTTYSTRASRFTQYNSGVKAEWDKLSYGPTSTVVKSCVHGFVDVTAYVGTKSDSFLHNMGDICIKV